MSCHVGGVKLKRLEQYREVLIVLPITADSLDMPLEGRLLSHCLRPPFPTTLRESLRLIMYVDYKGVL